MKRVFKIVILALLLLAHVPLWAQKADDYRDKASQGDKIAQYNLGVCYLNGFGVEKDVQKAIYWCEKSAKQEYAAAQYCLGTIYLEQQNYQEAMSWLTKASNQHYADAEYQMAVVYSNGLGVAKDSEKTYYWLTKAAMHGCKDAREILDDIVLEKKQGDNGKYGFVNKEGEERIPFVYDEVEPFYQAASTVWDYVSDDYYFVPASKSVYVSAKKNGKWGIIDKANNTHIPFEYDSPLDYVGNALFRTSKNGKKGYIDEQNNIVVPFEYDMIEDFFSYLKVSKNGKYGLIAREGYKVALPFEFDKIESANKYYAAVRKGAKWGIVKVNVNSEVVIPFEYDELSLFSEGLARVKKNGKWGFVDSNNKTVIPFEYEEAGIFREDGTASVKKQGRWGTIDKNNHFTKNENEKEDNLDDVDMDEDGQKESITIKINGYTGFVMRFVEGGTFQMGSNDSDAFQEQKPVHSVTVGSFYMGDTEVTQLLWKVVMGSNPSNWKGNTLPVEGVSWEDCQEFIRKLNDLTGKNFRLPTEAEWEYAARGGRKSKGYKYSGSNNANDVAWYMGSNNHEQGPQKIKGKQANELGLYDMSGNVWEWCEDWYGNYSSNAQTNPKGPSKGTYHVVRGGSWFNNDAKVVRVSTRLAGDPDDFIGSIGLRLCLPQ